MPIILGLILLALSGYLWGSIPSGYWMGKLLRGKDFDIRDYGSHKTGATNVLRTLGRGPAAIVFAVDLSKGVGPTLLATFIPFFYLSGWGPTIVLPLWLGTHNCGFDGPDRSLFPNFHWLQRWPWSNDRLRGSPRYRAFCLSSRACHNHRYHSDFALCFSWLHRWCADGDALWYYFLLRRAEQSNLYWPGQPGATGVPAG